MARRTVVFFMVLIVLTSVALQQENNAQECRVYQLKTGTAQYETPLIPVQNLFTVSFYNNLTGQYPNGTQVLLKGSSRNASVYINPHGEVSLRLNEVAQNATFAFPPASQNNTWVTLAILLQDSSILVYRMDDRESIIAARASIGSNVTARVTTSKESLHLTINCPAGCLVHDNTSYLIGRQLALGGGSANIYVWHDEGAQEAKLQLGFRDKNGGSPHFTLDVTSWEPSVWNRVTIGHNQDKHVRVLANNEEKEVGKTFITEEDLAFSILSVNSVLWSLHCYPDNVTGEDDWSIIIPTHKPTTPPGEDSEGAGIGEVLAWVLAGMALFLVMIMALVLCTRMGPRNDTLDYGASVGVVTSFGRTMMQHDAVREAEEDTEPDSPTLMAPVININHKVPEEVDEDQTNTKML